MRAIPLPRSGSVSDEELRPAGYDDFCSDAPPSPPPTSPCRVCLVLAALFGTAILTMALTFLIPHPGDGHSHSHMAMGVPTPAVAPATLPPVAPGMAMLMPRHPDHRAPPRMDTALRATLPTMRGVRETTTDGGFAETWAFDVGSPRGPLTQRLACPAGQRLVPVCLPLPLGIAFEGRPADGKYRIFVEEIVPGSNAAAADVKVGDVLRACTALFQVKGELNELGYFGNPPKTLSLPGVYVADDRSFDQAMAALKSNAAMMDGPDGRKQPVDSVCLLLQRQEPAAAPPTP